MHDKNLVANSRINLVSHLRQKRDKNKRLMRMHSKEEENGGPVPSLSFNLDGTRVDAEERVPERVPSHVCKCLNTPVILKFVIVGKIHRDENEVC